MTECLEECEISLRINSSCAFSYCADFTTLARNLNLMWTRNKLCKDLDLLF